MSRRILMVVNAEWYFWSHRLVIARALARRGYEVLVAAAVERQLDRAIEAEGFRFVPIRMVRGRVGPLAELQTLRDLVGLYRRERPDVVYQTTIKPILYGSAAAKLAGRHRLINAIPGLGHTFGAANLQRSIVASAYRWALRGPHTRVIFQNQHDLELFLSLRLVEPRRAVLIRGSGVDINQFEATPEDPCDRPPIVLLASRLVWEKGVGELVEASRRLRDGGVRCRVVIVGIPDRLNPRAVPESALRQWQADGLIEWWGLRADMPNVFRQASVVAFPSYYREGVPKVLLEAAASGRPIVTTDWPGCQDVVQHEYNGVLVPPRDVPALADALARLVTDLELRRSMGARGRLRAEREFAESVVVEQTLAVFDDLLDS